MSHTAIIGAPKLGLRDRIKGAIAAIKAIDKSDAEHQWEAIIALREENETLKKKLNALTTAQLPHLSYSEWEELIGG